jgi:GAF domain-containing protein
MAKERSLKKLHGRMVEEIANKQVFLEEDLRFTYIFAQHAAVAIERAQLLEEGDRLRKMVSPS